MQVSTRSYLIFLASTGVHFGISFVGAAVLFLTFGLERPDVAAVFESVLVAGVTFLGLPDTMLGWLLNSMLYGLLVAVVVHAWTRLISRIPRGKV